MKTKTKATTVMAITAILATTLVFPNIGPVEAFEMQTTKTAMTADTSDNLKPKAYGEKTKDALCNDSPCFDQVEEDQKTREKAQKIKDMRKAAEHKKVLAFMKNYYRI